MIIANNKDEHVQLKFLLSIISLFKSLKYFLLASTIT